MTDVTWIKQPLGERQEQLQQASSIEAAESLVSLVRAPKGWGVYASIGPNYQYAIFGRDSIEFAEDILAYFPDLAREIIVMAARLQGHQTDHTTEEEPGKIHHEYRALQFNGEPVPEAAVKVYERLRKLWGKPNAHELCYYGSIDATPLFIRLVERFVRHYGKEILSDTVTHYSGETITVQASVELAMDWLIAKIEASEWGLLEFKRLNPQGLPYQSWKDSETAFLHTNGQPANADGGIASIEVQGFAYDALLAGERLLEYPPNRSQYIMKLAQKLIHATIDHLWMKNEQFFAMGLDRDEQGSMRQIATLTSNAGLLLQTSLLEAFDYEEALDFVRPVVSKLMSEAEFLTPAGIRCRSLRHAGLVPIADYHGSLVTWPKDTANIADGLRKWGFMAEASELEGRLVRSILQAGEPYEFFYVDSKNHAKLHYRSEHASEPAFHGFGAANLPEPMQAWSLACFLKITLSGFAKE